MNLEAEYAFIGCILASGELIKETTVQAEHLYHESNKIIYRTMQKVDKAGDAIDLVTVITAIGNQNLKTIGGRSFLARLMNSVPSTKAFPTYEKFVLEAWKIREAKRIQTTNIATLEDISKLANEYTKIEAAAETDTYDHKNTLIELYENIQKQAHGLSGIDTGFRDLNNYLDGFQNKELIISAARPSVGKTAKMLNHAIAHCVKGGMTIIFSLEMDKELLHKRIISTIGRINGFKLKNPKQYFNKDDWDRFSNALAILSEMNIHIYDRAGQTVPYIRSVVKKLKRQHPDVPILVQIDYLQLLRSASTRGETRNIEVGEMTRSLKELAKDENIPVYLLSQLSRGVETRQDKRPRMSDIRDSGSVEQDADVIEFLYRDDYYDADSEAENIIEVIIAKQRNGPVGTVKLIYEKEYNLLLNRSEANDD
ncbi:MAG TPA: replicative DNA helicase [Pseudogracilibacillus sp.]|nr:replicative DNA helicase [Pseudogracilibacillus sp.]